MIDLFQVVLLSIIQGVTEFLPISSSAHLILVPQWLNQADQGIAFDIAVHMGSLIAVIAYFFKDIISITQAGIKHIIFRKLTNEAKLFWFVGIGTIPVGLSGLLFKNFISAHLRSAMVIAISTIVFAMLLWWAEKQAKLACNEKQINLKQVCLIGCAQALALIPGTSRSGITMTAGLFAGLTKASAARFSFLLAIPVIILAMLLEFIEAIHNNMTVVYDQHLLLAFAISAVTALSCIHIFLKLLDKIGFMPFIIYRLILGSVLLFTNLH